MYAQVVHAVAPLRAHGTRKARVGGVHGPGVFRQPALVREAAAAETTTERLQTEVALLMRSQSLPRLEALVTRGAREGDVGAVHELMRVQRRVSLERLVASLAGEDALLAVDDVVGGQVALVHKRVAADIAHEPCPVGRVAPPVGPQQHRRLVALVARVALVWFSVGVRRFVDEQRAVRDEPLVAYTTEERSCSGVKHQVHLEAVVVRKRLATDRTLEPPCLAVQRLVVILEVRRRHVRLVAQLTRVRTFSLVPEEMQLEAVIEVEPFVTYLAVVRLYAAVDASLVVVQRALSGKLLTALIARIAPAVTLHMACAMLA